MSLRDRLAEAGRRIGAREADHESALDAAREQIALLHDQVRDAVDAFHEAAHAAGARHLQLELSSPRTDDKHLRSVEFELARGRHRAIVVAKAKGEITLVGPFRAGKNEGPCRSFPFDAKDEVATALAGFLEEFVEEAAAP